MNRKKHVYEGKITFNITESHPDRKYVEDMSEKLTFTDIYTFEDIYSDDSAISYIKNDLSIVAGGGYDNKHIINVSYDINKK